MKAIDLKLQHSYPAVLTSVGLSVGGSQMWSDNRIIQKCGCGPVAAFDLCCYLENREYGRSFQPILSKAEYSRSLEQIQKKYFPLLYPSGINGVLLASGLNRLFRDRFLPWHARWVSSGRMLFDRVQSMLAQDIPVILSVGPNFPFFWQKHALPFYLRNRRGELQQVTSVCGHYVTVIAINSSTMTISSWGHQYEIKLEEYRAFVRKHSNNLFSNIILIEKKG